jgi:hypothetical protein
MANIVMTSTTNTVKCDNGIYAGTQNALGLVMKKVAFRKDEIFRIGLAPSDAYVIVEFKSKTSFFLLNFDGATGAMQVDSIDAVAPTSNSDLYDKLVTLLG